MDPDIGRGGRRYFPNPRGEPAVFSQSIRPMDLDFDDGTAAVDAAAAITAVEREVRGKYPMIRRLFIEAGAAPAQWRWSRPDSTEVRSDAR